MSDTRSNNDSDVVWTPPGDLLDSCAMTAFMRALEHLEGVQLSSYEELHRWSVTYPELFWRQVATFLELVGEGDLHPLHAHDLGPTPLARRWFPNYALNFAENLLVGEPDQLAIVSWSEHAIKRRLSNVDVRTQVGRVVRYLSGCGLRSEDKVFAYMPNIPESVTCMLATAALGGTWSSCGTDYQVEGLLARMERVRPRIFIAADSYLWRGVTVSLRATIEEVVRRTPSIEHVLLVDYLNSSAQTPIELGSGLTVASYNELGSAPLPKFKRFPFSHPLYIMFSSGTTGKPKGIVHSAGGTLLEHKKEMVLHSDIRPGDRVFYQTSTSWMMWNWLVSALSCRAAVLMYDGDPMLEQGEILWRLAQEEHVTHFGTSAAYLGELEKRGVSPSQRFPLEELRAIFSTGSTLFPHSFDYVMRSIKPLWLQSISGGTDILGCFGLGCPLKPVIRGEVQCKSLGYDVRVFDSYGSSIIAQQGELVCASPAPSMPIRFLDDADGAGYRQAYFSDFAGVWRHGDYVLETEGGGLVFSGRSDATLKPGGIRIATADIYAALERVAQVVAALVVGYSPPGESSERIVLFVVLSQGVRLEPLLEDEIRRELKRSNAFYVPALILEAPELPRTTNNKLAELSVKRILHGVDPGNSAALANPESLDFFRNSAAPRVRAEIS